MTGLIEITPILPTIPVVVYVPDINDSSAELVIDPGCMHSHAGAWERVTQLIIDADFVSFVLFVVSRRLCHCFTAKNAKSAKMR